VLKESQPAVHLYSATTRKQLVHRFRDLGPVRSVSQASASFLE
jgi:hypothetical protein